MPGSLHRRMPQVKSHTKLDGVYGLRQPGFSPHPVLRHRIEVAPAVGFPDKAGLGERRQQQRNDLRRSASLVLGQSKSSASTVAVVHDAERTSPHFAEWSAGTTPQGPLQSLRGPYWPKWSQPAFMDDLPPRLEDCRARLAAAEYELDRYSKAAGGSGFRAVKQQHELPAWTQAFSETDVLQPLSTVEPPPGSGRPGMREPAPEPPLATSLLGAEGDEEAELRGTAESDGDEELPKQLLVLESQLLELDAKWQAVDKDKQDAQRRRDELAVSLGTSKAQEDGLSSQQLTLKSRLKEVETEAEALCKNLSVSESDAQVLRGQLGTLESREQLLQAQATALYSRLYVSEGDALELRELLAERLRAAEAEVHRPAHEASAEQLAANRKAEGEVHKWFDLQLAAQRAAAGRREADLMKALAAATQRHTLAEEALEAGRKRAAVLRAEEDARRAAARAGAPSRPETPFGPWPGSDIDEARPVSADHVSDDWLAGLGVHAVIPELLFTANLDVAGEPSSAHGHRRWPTHCQLDLVRNELRLQALAPYGAACELPLQGLAAVAWPPPGGGPPNVVELQLPQQEGPNLGLCLAAPDARAAGAVAAALTLPDRVPPGCLLEPMRGGGAAAHRAPPGA